MKAVVLKSKVGPMVGWTAMRQFTDEYGNQRHKKTVYDFSTEKDCRETVPLDYWEEIRDEFYDRKEHIKYRDLVKELRTIDA